VRRGKCRSLVVVEPHPPTAPSHLQLSIVFAPPGGEEGEEEEVASQVGGGDGRWGRRGDGDADLAPPSRPPRPLPRVAYPDRDLRLSLRRRCRIRPPQPLLRRTWRWLSRRERRAVGKNG
jgi:hypothetical protein